MFDAAQRIIDLLNAHDMKQADLCRETGIKSSLMSNYIKGKASPKLSNAILIANAFKLSLDEFAFMNAPDHSEKSDTILDKTMQKLASNYSELNNFGKEKLLSYSEDLVGNPRYRINPASFSS